MPFEFMAHHLRGVATLPFPEMELLARDHEPPIIAGAGELRIVSDTEFAYDIRGRPENPGDVLRALRRLRDDPYDGLNRFRLVMRDAAAREWSGGWTVPDVSTGDAEWRFRGVCDILGVAAERPPHRGESEARFLIPRDSRAAILFRRFLPAPAEPRHGPRERVIEVLGTPITFSYDDAQDILTLRAPFAAPFLPPYAENWLGEPLRILFGQLAYPRLLGRHFADGQSNLTLLPSPAWSRDSAWLALWMEDDRLTDAEGFFELYGGLLRLVAAGGAFENHTVTEYYGQAIQAARGSRWVVAMTLASSIEGLARLLVPRGTLRPDADAEALQSLIDHLNAWQGSQRLKDAARSFVGNLDQVAVPRALQTLAQSGVCAPEQVAAWRKVRNSVMHGELISPYSSEEDDRLLVQLADLMRALTRELVRRT